MAERDIDNPTASTNGITRLMVILHLEESELVPGANAEHEAPIPVARARRPEEGSGVAERALPHGPDARREFADDLIPEARPDLQVVHPGRDAHSDPSWNPTPTSSSGSRMRLWNRSIS